MSQFEYWLDIEIFTSITESGKNDIESIVIGNDQWNRVRMMIIFHFGLKKKIRKIIIWWTLINGHSEESLNGMAENDTKYRWRRHLKTRVIKFKNDIQKKNSNLYFKPISQIKNV